MVDAIRNIPIIEKDMPQPMIIEEDQTGFPFDRDVDRDSSFRNQLDDIAKRHPELAEHFEGFPFRSNSSNRRQYSDETDGFPSFTNRDRPFGSRFEQYGFPFTRDSPFSEESHKHPSEAQNSPSQRQETSRTQATPNSDHQNSSESTSQQKPPQAPERGRRQGNIQQSNTADLTQKQEPVNDRNQRSMSAPPPENRSQPRYVSSINIPIQRDPGQGDGNIQHSHPQGTPQQSSKPTERVIPIHVEGRDEPVLPKNVHQTYSQPNTHGAFSHPEPEHIFGGRNMGDFMGRNTGRFTPREDVFTRQYQMPQEQRYQRQQTPPPKAQPTSQQHRESTPQQHREGTPQQNRESTPQQQNVPQQHSAPPQQQNAPTAPPQQEHQQQQPPSQSQKPSPIDQIKAIQKDVSELMEQVDRFSGAPRDKQYLYLDEMLTRNLIKLDNIDTQGQENIRSARREAVRCIEKCISILESKANANVAAKNEKGEKMEVDQKPSEEQLKGSDQTQDSMETEVSSTTNDKGQSISTNEKEQKVEVKSEPMEVTSGSSQSCGNQLPPSSNADQKESSEASAKTSETQKETETTVSTNNNSAEHQGQVKSEGNITSNTTQIQKEGNKMEVELQKPAESNEAAIESEHQSPPQPDSSSQANEESKDESKKEKKKGKKKEKTDKK